MAKLSSLTFPIFTEIDGKRIELGEVEIPFHVSLEMPKPQPTYREGVERG